VNYLHHHLFLKAYEAKTNKNYAEALTQLNQAINNAKSGDFYLWVALGYELLGELCSEMDLMNFAADSLREARYFYDRFGMLAKVKSLEERYPECAVEKRGLLSSSQSESLPSLDTGLGGTTSTTLDFMSIIKASQAISGEIILNRLLEKILRLIAENAGAETAIFIEKNKSDWIVTAKLAMEHNEVKFEILNIPLSTAQNIPQTIIQFSIRSGETVVLSNATESNQYKNDAYVLHAQPKSILCLPVVYKDNIHSIIYLENNLTMGAFSEDRITVLTTLASQIAISLENARLYYQATHDSLTGLANRNLLYQTFERLAEQSKTTSHTSIAILLFDLDYFKDINDKLGHLVGDKVLIHIADLINTCIGKENLGVRLGGDEFVAMMEYKDVKEVTDAAQQFLQKLKEPIKIEGHELTLSCSIGISLYPHDSETIPELLKQADIALYQVKAKGKNQFQLYASPHEKEGLKPDYMQS
jgi:diguanylate cyclase (GGDEF)-like protein